ncbi:hypothetical protein BpHYR1_029339 [Brachionus plicatilis]|uniref:Uncharacterized protein n=1 Tax=Brachionus plicatilis TaxID=10195 RepID=A0A3M7PDG8_BRAPC|nr:hypothetical protein BpHYR1_029339 [Brachionus plicatilis]
MALDCDLAAASDQFDVRTADILMFVSDEVLYHTGRPSNISSHQNMLINLSDKLYKNFVRCSQASLFDEPKCAFDSPGRDQRRILTFRLDKNIALNGVKSILDKFSNYLVFCVDVNNSFNFVQKKYGNELKRAEINVNWLKLIKYSGDKTNTL